jgi:hypothetical protein
VKTALTLAAIPIALAAAIWIATTATSGSETDYFKRVAGSRK